MNFTRPHPRPAGAARLVPSPAELPSAWKTAWPWLFWLLWGVWLAVSDLRNDDIQPAVFRLMIGSLVLGYARPHTWWLWSLALAAWVPAEPLVAAIFRMTNTFQNDFVGWCLPPLPALVGGFLGRGIALGVVTRRRV